MQTIISDANSAQEQDYEIETKTFKNQDEFINCYYLHNKDNSDVEKKLIIFLTGSELACVMGANYARKKMYSYILDKLSSYTSFKFEMLLPDKANIGIGDQDCDRNVNVMRLNTLQDRVNGTIMLIDDFLSNNTYRTVIIMGLSEGGKILPRVYNNLKHRDKVSSLVLLASGGITRYEELKLLPKSSLQIPEDYRYELEKIDAVIPEIIADASSLLKTYLGMTYRRWSGYLQYCPLNELIEIDIPILAIHGDGDIVVPIESSRKIAEEFSKQEKKILHILSMKTKDITFLARVRKLLKIWLNG